MIYIRYLYKLLRHKWFVFRACCKHGIPWRGVVHDLSKFLPSEFIPYARYFCGEWGRKTQVNFGKAVLRHYHRNEHHWQWWVVVYPYSQERSDIAVCKMPDCYVREMVADWLAMNELNYEATRKWYTENEGKIILHDDTRDEVVKLLYPLMMAEVKL